MPLSPPEALWRQDCKPKRRLHHCEAIAQNGAVSNVVVRFSDAQ
jgi:hypothetical protein